jgi:hypothetical protein
MMRLLNRPGVAMAGMLLAILAWRSTQIAETWYQSEQAIGNVVLCLATFIGLVFAREWRERRKASERG